VPICLDSLSLVTVGFPGKETHQFVTKMKKKGRKDGVVREGPVKQETHVPHEILAFVFKRCCFSSLIRVSKVSRMWLDCVSSEDVAKGVPIGKPRKMESNCFLVVGVVLHHSTPAIQRAAKSLGEENANQGSSDVSGDSATSMRQSWWQGLALAHAVPPRRTEANQSPTDIIILCTSS